MGKPHPVGLRERVVAFVGAGNGHREAARHFMVSPKFVTDRIKLGQATGGLAPKRQGHRGWGKLAGFGDWAKALPSARPDLTSDQIRAELGRRP